MDTTFGGDKATTVPLFFSSRNLLPSVSQSAVLSPFNAEPTKMSRFHVNRSQTLPQDSVAEGGNRNAENPTYTVDFTFDGVGSESPSEKPQQVRYPQIIDHPCHPQQALACTTKLKKSDYQPCLPAEGPNRYCTCAPLPCWRPGLPPSAVSHGKPSRTIKEYGSGWSKYHPPLCPSQEWLDPIYVPPKQHPAGVPGYKILPWKVRPRLPYGKNVGDILPNLRLRPTDVFIRPCISSYDACRRGYVGFVKNSQSLVMEAGSMLMRIAKASFGAFRIRKCIKLFLRTVDGCWRFKGNLDADNFFNLKCDPSNYQNIPSRYRHILEANTADERCIPQRGDIVIHEPWKDLQHTDRPDKCSTLKWFLPTVEIDLNDVLVRMCVWKSCSQGTEYDGFVDLFMYSGRSLNWVFLGRDETVFKALGLEPDSDTSDDEK